MRRAVLIGIFLLGLIAAGSAQAANVWSWDCGSNPTVSGPGVVGDWVVRGGGTFDTSKLTTSAIDGSSVWTGNGGTAQIVDTSPLDPFTTLTTVDLRWRATSTTPEHAWFSINIDYSDGTMAPIFAYLSVAGGGASQTLRVVTKDNSHYVEKELFNITGLGLDFIRTQLVLDPDANTVSLAVNGVNQGTLGYVPFAPQNGDRFASVLGSQMELDYIGINTSTAATPVPAPAALLLLAPGLAGLVAVRRRRK